MEKPKPPQTVTLPAKIHRIYGWGENTTRVDFVVSDDVLADLTKLWLYSDSRVKLTVEVLPEKN